MTCAGPDNAPNAEYGVVRVSVARVDDGARLNVLSLVEPQTTLRRTITMMRLALRGAWTAIAGLLVVATSCTSSHHQAAGPARLSSTTDPGITQTLGNGSPISETAAPCSASQLALDYRGQGVGPFGLVLGSIVVRDTGTSPCLLSGQVEVTPVGPEGRPVESFHPLDVVAVPTNLILTAHGPLWGGQHGIPLGEGGVVVSGESRDDPVTGQKCAPPDEITPAFWDVTMAGGSWAVANHDDGPDSQMRMPSISACLGDFAVGQVQVSTPS